MHDRRVGDTMFVMNGLRIAVCALSVSVLAGAVPFGFGFQKRTRHANVAPMSTEEKSRFLAKQRRHAHPGATVHKYSPAKMYDQGSPSGYIEFSTPDDVVFDGAELRTS